MTKDEMESHHVLSNRISKHAQVRMRRVVISWDTNVSENLAPSMFTQNFYRRKNLKSRTDRIWKQGAVENIWTQKAGSERRLEKTA
jgi:hypothetical protein